MEKQYYSKWERPLHSIFWMSLSCSIVWINPVYLLISCLLPVPPIMVIEFVRTCGKRKVLNKKYVDYFIRKDESYQQLLKKASQEKWREHLNTYLDILIALQRMFSDMIDYFEYIHSVVTWKRPKTSLLFLLSSLALEFSLYIFEMGTVLFAIILCCFIVNKYLYYAIIGMVLRIRHQLVALTFKPVPKSPRVELDAAENNKEYTQRKENVASIGGDELDYSSSSESDEGDLSDNKRASSIRPTGNQPSASMMSKFIPRSIRRRYMSAGVCSNCDQPASTILKRRRYCRHCGNSFCAKCCNTRVARALLGATAPAAYQEKVLVCEPCRVFLMNRLKTTPTELLD
ncbi:protrudin-like isoform X2 [Hydractinia symbiolongicarpus]|uniref:protrudin-like isoform X2 n=1 Tax=Hydractinia symbiolongicarpus TaxID=13093 RepID=UPI002549C736|nr:protrudin-like isoform X2 [Hydractinia symbiolongicarpus]